jgi:hypothetical protein
MTAILIRKYFEAARVNAITGKLGTGKTHFMVLVMYYLWKFFGYKILTNLVFKRRTGPGKRDWVKEYPPGLYPAVSFMEIVKRTAHWMKEEPRPTTGVFLDEIQNFMDAMMWSDSMVVDICRYFSLIRKYKQTWALGNPTFRKLPAAIRDWERNVLSYHFSKDLGSNGLLDFNRRSGKRFEDKEIIFVEDSDPTHKSRPLHLGTCPWNRPEDETPVGAYCYDTLSMGSSLELGHVEGVSWNEKKKMMMVTRRNFSFADLLKWVQFEMGQDIPARILGYINYLESGAWCEPRPGPKEIVLPPSGPVKHALPVVRLKYDDPSEEKEVRDVCIKFLTLNKGISHARVAKTVGVSTSLVQHITQNAREDLADENNAENTTTNDADQPANSINARETPDLARVRAREKP